jgi:hypothetical protein
MRVMVPSWLALIDTLTFSAMTCREKLHRAYGSNGVSAVIRRADRSGRKLCPVFLATNDDGLTRRTSFSYHVTQLTNQWRLRISITKHFNIYSKRF